MLGKESNTPNVPDVPERDSHRTEMPGDSALGRAPLGTGQANMGSRSGTSDTPSVSLVCPGLQIRKLDSSKAGDLVAALRVAEIRNAGREWFTGDTSEISAGDQVLWFWSQPRSLWVAEIDDEVVGFALLTEKDGKTWIGLGVHPEHQGKGIGTCLYARFFDVWAEIRADNVASRRAAEKAGYRVVSDNGWTVVMHQ